MTLSLQFHPCAYLCNISAVSNVFPFSATVSCADDGHFNDASKTLTVAHSCENRKDSTPNLKH